MRHLAPRQVNILEQARRAGHVTVETLAQRFDVTPQTIRKDLNVLCERHFLQRVHGGAVLPSGVANYAYEARRGLAAEDKRRIGLKAASLIPDNCSLFINIGTTTEQVARALHGRAGLLVITNNLNVANILYGLTDIEVIVAGGTLRPADGGIVGDMTVDAVAKFKVDFGVIGTSAIDGDGTMLDYDYREVRVSQAIIENSRHTILVADSIKYERTAPVRIGHLSQMNSFVTERTPPKALERICEENDVAIEIADEISGELSGEISDSNSD